uniref:Serpin domain-containing protein n=1 Tax=Sphaeramia orbicularis TaxID=375764 RepID=A0A672Y5R1_9TELE
FFCDVTLTLTFCFARRSPVQLPEPTDLPQSGEHFSPKDYRAMGGAIEQLGLELLQNLPVGPQQPNVILSPLSVAFALAQSCARNETEKLLMKSLHANSLPCYHHILGGLVPHFTNTSLEVAARMYLKPGFDVKLSFLEESLARYRSQPSPLVSVEEINQWVEKATNSHVQNFLESIPHEVVLMLINAVYFKGEWQTRFNPQATTKGVFYLDGQNFVSVDMMSSGQYPVRVMHDPELKAQVASFPFKGNASFLIVMPILGRANVSSVLPRLNISDLYSRLPPEKAIMVNLPKVKLQYREELKEALTNMGLGSLFSVSVMPVLSTLSEEGVEAAATDSRHGHTHISPSSPLTSPFLFALVDDTSLTPLFMGVYDPHGNSTMSDQPEAAQYE